MIYYVSCTNIHKGDGSRENPFRTIRQAAAKARTGDTIVIGGGKYREMVEPVYGGQSDLARITYSAAEGEKVIISGAEAFDHWERQEGRLWKTTVDNAVFGDVNPFDTLICGDWYDNFGQDHHTAEVYLEDEALYEAASYNALISMDKPMTWFAVAHEDLTEVWANFGDVDPNTTCTEYNARVSCFFPRHEGVDYITLKGITFEKAATQWAPPTGFQIGLVGVHWSKGWIIEDCEIRHSKCSGLSLGKRYEEDDNLWTRNGLKGGTQTYTETIIKNSQRDWKKEYVGSHIVRRNHIHHCGQTGIVGCMGAAFSLIEHNLIHDINNRKEFGGAEMAGIKLHAAVDVVIRNNCIHDCNRGLWLDWEAQGGIVSENIFYNNLIDEDLFIEVNHGPVLVKNNFMLSPTGYLSFSQGEALVHNYFAGEIKLFREMRRFTIYHRLHSTAVLGTMYLYGGDDRLIGNVFSGETAGTYVYDGYRDARDGLSPNWEDDQSSKSIRTLPVDIHSNLYCAGAKAYAREEDARFCDTPCSVTVSENGCAVTLSVTGAHPDQSVSLVSSDMLGVAFQPNQRFENTDGTPIVIDSDIQGKPRTESCSAAGPINNSQTDYTLTWTL